MTRERELERERYSYYVLGACCYVCVEVERLKLRACGNTQAGPTRVYRQQRTVFIVRVHE